MKIEQAFEIAHPRDIVWDRMCDVRLVAECLPGAAIIADLEGDRYKGQFSVRLGPIAASFDGEVAIERDPRQWTAVVSGKGADARSSSRASGSMTYRLDGSGDAATIVHVVTEVALAGALAQFGKGAIIQEVANRITAEFVQNFERRLAAAAGGASATGAADSPDLTPRQDAGLQSTAPSKAMDAGSLLWSILADRVGSFIKQVLGFASAKRKT